jgi:histidine triad (HIT) family protein
VFCDIVHGAAPAEVVHRWDDATAFVPLNPVTPGHVLVVPNTHVRDAAEDPAVTAQAMYRAADLASRWPAFNLISSAGAAATQTIFHLHWHLVPRCDGDGLPLPWTGQNGDH